MPSHFADEPEYISLLRETLRRFVAAEMPAERRQQWDREHRFPRELFAKLAALGVCGLTVMGAYGLSEGHDMERNVRDLLGMPIVGGSSEMQRNNLARRWGLPE